MKALPLTPLMAGLLVLLGQFALVLGAPPSQLLPSVPGAILSSISPTKGNVNDANINTTLRGQFLEEEFGTGSLRCKFHLKSGPVIVCARRDLQGCVPSAAHQGLCTTTKISCVLPAVATAERILVQVANDFGVITHTNQNDAVVPHVHADYAPGGEGFWSKQQVYFTYVPTLSHVNLTTAEVLTTPLIKLTGSGFLDIAGNRTTRCVFLYRGWRQLFPAPLSLEQAVHRGQLLVEDPSAPAYHITAATITSNSTVECRVPRVAGAQSLLVALTPDFANSSSGACSAQDPCNHLTQLSPATTFTFLPITQSVTPSQGPWGVRTPVTLRGLGFSLGQQQVVGSGSSRGTLISGWFRLAMTLMEDTFDSQGWQQLAGYRRQHERWDAHPYKGRYPTQRLFLHHWPASGTAALYSFRGIDPSPQAAGAAGGFSLRSFHLVKRAGQAGSMPPPHPASPLPASSPLRCDGALRTLPAPGMTPDQVSYWFKVGTRGAAAGGFTLIHGGCAAVNSSSSSMGGSAGVASVGVGRVIAHAGVSASGFLTLHSSAAGAGTPLNIAVVNNTCYHWR